jgi:hypothetical protein
MTSQDEEKKTERVSAAVDVELKTMIERQREPDEYEAETVRRILRSGLEAEGEAEASQDTDPGVDTDTDSLGSVLSWLAGTGVFVAGFAATVIAITLIGVTYLTVGSVSVGVSILLTVLATVSAVVGTPMLVLNWAATNLQGRSPDADTATTEQAG